jgi:hypothetical protein
MNPAVKGALKSKAMWLSALLTAVGVLEVRQAELLSYIPPHWQGAALIIMGIAFGVIRSVTSQSLTDKGSTQQ